jgi:hypothetical protein
MQDRKLATEAPRARRVLPLALLALTAVAQAETFDIAGFEPPRGWEVERRERLVGYTTVNRNEGYYCRIILYAAERASGDARRDFESEWKAVMVNDARADREPQPRPGRTRNGTDYLAAEAKLDLGGQSLWAQLNVLSLGAKVQSVKVMGSDKKRFAHCREPATAFLDSLRYAPVPAAKPAPAAASPPRAAGSGIAGVWMGIRQLMGVQKPRLAWIVFFDDGRVYEELPDEGLLGLDRAANGSGHWGRYRLDGGKGSYTKPDVSAIPIELIGPDKIKVSLTTYHRTRPVNGARLDGAWTTLGEPDDPWIEQQPPGQRPVIRFTPDGRFTDEGVFALHVKSGDPANDRAGKGEYEIRDYTLRLRYKDGREKRVAITGYLSAELAPRSEVIFLQRVRLNRRSR